MKTSKKITVFFVPITHHDLGYTHTIDDLLDAYCNYYDNILDYCDLTDSYPENAKYHYTVEQFWSLDYYLQHTTDENIQRLKYRVKEGRIELPAFYANVIDCICSNEELIRSMYPSFRFAEECGVTIKRAAMTDIPGMSGGIADVLTKAGVKYLFAGFPRYFEWADAYGMIPELKHTYWSEEFGRHAAWRWCAKSGESLLTWFQSGYGWFGNDANACIAVDSIDDVLTHLPGFVKELQEKGYPYDVLRYIYRGSDNEPPLAGISDIVKEWNEKYTDTGITLKVGTDTMFFEALEQQVQELPTLCGELPHTDYPVLSLTEAEMTARNKRARILVDSAERLGATGGTDTFKDIIMYDEHCFGMFMPVGELQEYNRSMKMQYVLRAALRARGMLQGGIDETSRESAEDTVSFFSPAGTPAHSIASFLTNEYEAGSYQLENLQTGEITYGESMPIEDLLLPIPDLPEEYAANVWAGGIHRVCFDLGRTQPMSYSTYRLTKIAQPAAGEGFENRFYRFEPDTMQIFDKECRRYLTDPNAPYPFASLLTRDIRNGVVHLATVLSAKKSFDTKVATGYLIRSAVYGAPEAVTELVFYHHVKRIDLSVRMVLDKTPLKEIYLAVPFAAQQPKFSYQGVNFFGEAFDPQFTKVNTNHYTVQNYVKVTGQDTTAVLSMAEGGTVCFGGLHTTEVSHAHHMVHPVGYADDFVSPEEIDKGHVYVMLAYNNCRTNFAMVQQGEVIYQYAITSGERTDPLPFAEGFVYAPVWLGKNQVVPYRHLKSTASNVFVQHCKPAENGNGKIVRLRETAGRETPFALDFGEKVCLRATVCDVLENDMELVNVQTLSIKPYGLLTLRLVEEKEYDRPMKGE